MALSEGVPREETSEEKEELLSRERLAQTRTVTFMFLKPLEILVCRERKGMPWCEKVEMK